MRDKDFRWWRRVLILFVLVPVLLSAGPAAAENQDTDFDFDIFFSDDTLVIWLDLTPILTQEKMEDLLAGFDVCLHITTAVERPKRLFFSKKIIETEAAICIAHPLTEDIYKLKIVNHSIRQIEFENQLELSDFLADSVVLPVAPRSVIPVDERVRLRCNLISKSHSNNMFDAIGSTAADSLPGRQERGEDVFESVFSLFLDLIAFGKTAYEITSPDFLAKDLPSF